MSSHVRARSRALPRTALQGVWASFASEVTGRRVPGTMPLALVSAVIVIAVSCYTIANGSVFAYADAQSHLTIARRIFDSLMPGFAQLGTVWLPLPNILLIPFTSSLWLWSSGWAAAILGAICMAGTVASLYRIGARIGLGRAGRLVAPLLVMTNPSLLYVSTTGLSEPVLILFLSATAAGLTSWATSPRPMSAGELMVFCGLPATGAVLSRYEGWALIASGSLFVFIVTLRRFATQPRGIRYKKTVKNLSAFLLWPLLGAGWWLAYNYVMYSDPLEFLRGEYSASALQAPVSNSGLLAYKGDVGLTLWSYHWAIVGTAGAVTLLLAAIGLVIATAKFGLTNRGLCVWLLATGWAFSLLSLYLGQTHMNNMHTLPQGWWNNRYALVSLIWLAVLVGVLVDALVKNAQRSPLIEQGSQFKTPPNTAHTGRSILTRSQFAWLVRLTKYAAQAGAYAVLIALVAQFVWMLSAPTANSAVLAEAEQYMVLKSENGTDAAAAYLAEHYDGGLILMDESAAGNAILPQIGLPLREYLNRSTGEMFDEALANPTANADWIFYSVAEAPQLSSAGVADLVYGMLLESPQAAAAYATVFSSGVFVIAKRIGS